MPSFCARSSSCAPPGLLLVSRYLVWRLVLDLAERKRRSLLSSRSCACTRRVIKLCLDDQFAETDDVLLVFGI
jgi:hypothetical protein